MSASADVNNGIAHVSLADTERPSPLLALAAELRNAIYEYALIDPSGIRIPRSGRMPPPALFHVNRQVRAETRGIYYAGNAFTAIVGREVNNRTPEEIMTWVTGVDPLIRGIVGQIIIEGTACQINDTRNAEFVEGAISDGDPYVLSCEASAVFPKTYKTSTRTMIRYFNFAGVPLSRVKLLMRDGDGDEVTRVTSRVIWMELVWTEWARLMGHQESFDWQRVMDVVHELFW